MKKPLKILFSAYACEPNHGSELGIGWGTVSAVSDIHETWVITRTNNKKCIGKELKKHPNENLHFVYYDLPKVILWLKKRGLGMQLYYYLWNSGVRKLIQNNVELKEFDIYQHITWGRCWMPCAFFSFNIPYIFGPVGGVETTPKSLLATLPILELLKERFRTIMINTFSLLPSVKKSIRNAHCVLATSPEALEYVRKMGAKKSLILTNSGISIDNYNTLAKTPINNNRTVNFISMGRLVAWKGFHLGIKAFAKLDIKDSEYWIVGDGTDRQRLETLVRKLGIEKNVKFYGWVPREEGLKLLEQCNCLVHPSFHDSGGMVCAEAMAAGRPVICLNCGGPATQVEETAGYIIKTNSEEQIVTDISNAMNILFDNSKCRNEKGVAGRVAVKNNLTWQAKAMSLSKLYYEILDK
ncbi:MAG: glycosyltransferase [Kiritimatiellae bacterium]|jgi:glycosyltransferase involved in cell wall biosynthesis|nr:glycosyltransferase [Kiritimatiellia bacterium]